MPCRSWYKKKLIIMVLMRIWVEQMANKTPRTHRINGLIYSVVHVTPDMSGNGCRSFLSLSFSFQYAGEFPFQGVFPPPHKHIHAAHIPRTCGSNGMEDVFLLDSGYKTTNRTHIQWVFFAVWNDTYHWTLRKSMGSLMPAQLDERLSFHRWLREWHHKAGGRSMEW